MRPGPGSRQSNEENWAAGPPWEGKKPRAKTLTQEKAEGASTPEANPRGALRANPTTQRREGSRLRGPGRSPAKARPPV